MKQFTIADVNLSSHHCKNAVISCIDFRFQHADFEFIKSLFGLPFDHIKVPGAGKNLAHEGTMQDALIATLKNVCIGLHGVSELLIVNHWDCGAYGGSKAFSSAVEEERAHREDLLKARLTVQKYLPELDVKIAYSKLTEEGLRYIIV